MNHMVRFHQKNGLWRFRCWLDIQVFRCYGFGVLGVFLCSKCFGGAFAPPVRSLRGLPSKCLHVGKCLSQLRQQSSLAVWEEMWYGDWWPERCLNNWFEFPPSAEKDRNEQPQQLNFPNVKNRREAKTIQSVRTWLVFNRLFVTLPACGNVQQKGRFKGSWFRVFRFRVSGVWGVLGVQVFRVFQGVKGVQGTWFK